MSSHVVIKIREGKKFTYSILFLDNEGLETNRDTATMARITTYDENEEIIDVTLGFIEQ